MNHNHKNCLKKTSLTSSPTSWNWNFLSNNNVVIPIVIASLSLLPSMSSPSSIYNHTWAYIWLVDCCLLMAMLQHAWVRGGDYDDYGSNTVYSRCPRFQKSNGYLNLSKFEFVKWRWASINRRIGRSVWEPRRRPSLSRSTWCFTGPWNLFQGSMFGSNASIEPPEALFVPLFTQENMWDVPVNLQRYLLWIYTRTCEEGTSDCISLAY